MTERDANFFQELDLVSVKNPLEWFLGSLAHCLPCLQEGREEKKRACTTVLLWDESIRNSQCLSV